MPTIPPPLFRERLAPLVRQDIDPFLDSIFKGVRKSIRVNTNLISVEQFRAKVQKQKWQLQPVPWCDTGFFVEREDKSLPLGKTPEHLLGLCYIQEASSMLPAEILQPTGKDIVLDMAAAPGSKTTQLSCLMKNNGLIVANDFSASRAKAIATNIERQGSWNVGMTNLNGKTINDRLPNFFDKILLDAPCSGEGTCFKDPIFFQHWSIHTIRKNAGLQKSLIAAAFQALRPGGTLVYSTCTYAPEENEEVVTFLLERFKGNAQILPSTRRDGMHCVSTGFDMPEALRIFPHKTGTGGFFVCKIQKNDTTPGRLVEERFEATEKILRDKEKKQYETYLKKTYGIPPEIFESVLFSFHNGTLWIKPEKYTVLRRYIRVDRCGTELLKVGTNGQIRLLPQGAWLIAPYATQNTVTMNDEQFRQFFSGQDIQLSEEQSRAIITTQVLLVTNAGFSAGIGLWDLQTRKVKNQLPRYFLSM